MRLPREVPRGTRLTPRPARDLARRLAAWAGWVCVLAAMAVVLATRRGHIDQSHVVLPLLLVVLGGSATGGRALGLVLAAEAAVLVDYYFQPPYDTLAVAKPLDFVVLVSFFVTAGVAAQLLEAAHREAAAARRRADEVGELAAVGAAALGAAGPDAGAPDAGRTDAAAHAVAQAFVRALGLDGCAVADVAGASLAAVGTLVGAPAATPDADAAGAPAPAAADGLRAALAAAPVDVRVPLRISGREVGTLRLARAGGVRPEAARLAFLEALAHYAALAAERVRLVAEAEHAEALREADRMKDQLLAAVSHDLRTPLTTIKALAHESARRGDANAGIVEEQADRLTRMVADLLDLSRVRAGGVVVHPELNTAEDVVGALRRQVAGVLEVGTARPRALAVDLPDDDPPLAGTFDFVATLRTLGNLVENAHKYSPPGAPVEVAARGEGGALVFEVRDRGPGVPAGEREQIFAPFYRGAGRAADGGAGLGLATGRALAEAQGGALAYAPREGGGSVFVLRLPGVRLGELSGLGAPEGALADAAGPA